MEKFQHTKYCGSLYFECVHLEMDSIYPSTCNGSLFFTLQYRNFFMSIVRRFQIEDFVSSGDCALEFCALINFFYCIEDYFYFSGELFGHL